MASICIPNSFTYLRILLGTSSILAPVPNIRISTRAQSTTGGTRTQNQQMAYRVSERRPETPPNAPSSIRPKNSLPYYPSLRQERPTEVLFRLETPPDPSIRVRLRV